MPPVDLHLIRFTLSRHERLGQRPGLASTAVRALSLTGVIVAATAIPASAERIQNEVAVFSALDKVTARISKFKVELNKTVTFGALSVTPRACYSSPATEEPKTDTFVEVDEKQLDGTEKRIFTGWMFAESPGIYGLEHPTYDVWLTECENPVRSTAAQGSAQAQPSPDGDNATAAAPPQDANNGLPQDYRRRVRR
jgi:hypothetical protein